jgi:hypothetical protein
MCICIITPNYNNTYMYHLTDPTHEWDIGGVYGIYT